MDDKAGGWLKALQSCPQRCQDQRIRSGDPVPYYHRPASPQYGARISPSNLQKSEQCHFYAEGVQWYEERATARRTNYDDHYEQHKSFDVVDLQSNVTSTRKERFNIIKRISTGNLYLTNKRLIFEGQEKTTSIKLNTIVSVKAYKQGILVDKLTGENMLLLMDRDADSSALLIQHLLRSILAS